LAAIIMASLPGHAQAPIRFRTPGTDLDFQLPWEGPGSAAENPAALVDSQKAYVHYSRNATTSNGLAEAYLQGSIEIFPGADLGIGYFENSTAIDGSKSVYMISTTIPMAGYRIFSGANGFSLSAGVATPIYRFSAFGVVKSTTWSLDIGAHATTPVHPYLGRLKFGVAMKTLRSPRIGLPDDLSDYSAHVWNDDFSMLWCSPGRMFWYFGNLSLYEDGESSGNPYSNNGAVKIGVRNFGVEVRPLPWVGCKWERTWENMASLGLTFRIPMIAGLNIESEISWSNPRTMYDYSPNVFLHGYQDEGRGSIWAFSLAVGWK